MNIFENLGFYIRSCPPFAKLVPTNFEMTSPKKEPNLPKTDHKGGDTARESKSLSGVIAHHYNNAKEDTEHTRQQSRIFHMRAFNNWIKSNIINEFIALAKEDNNARPDDIRILDIGCGKGGDLRKYLVNNISYLLCTGEHRNEHPNEHYKEEFIANELIPPFLPNQTLPTRLLNGQRNVTMNSEPNKDGAILIEIDCLIVILFTPILHVKVCAINCPDPTADSMWP